MSDWAKLLGAPDSPYEFALGLEVGSVFKVPPPYPDLYVKSVAERYPRRIVVQKIDVEASAEEHGKSENIRVLVVVLETEDGEQIELTRYAAPVEELDAPVIDLTICEACGGEIPEGQARVFENKAYHPRCMTEESDEDRAIRAARSSNLVGGGVGGTGSGVGGSEKKQTESEDGAAPKASPKTVSKTRGIGSSISHMVTVTDLGDDKHMVTLWSMDNGGISGTASGRWMTGLCEREIPRESDVQYINYKFFKGAWIAKADDLRVWNRLYTSAMREMGYARFPSGSDWEEI